MNDEGLPDVRELAVRICRGCFTGEFNTDFLSDPRWGIDVFLNEPFIMRDHRCTGRVNPGLKNMWRQVTLRLSMPVYEQIIASRQATPGIPTDEPRFRKHA